MMTTMQQIKPITHVVNPMIVAGSVIALKCKEGIIIGTDTLLSYGSLLKYQDINRFEQISDDVIITATGEYADFQEATRRLRQMTRQAFLYDDNQKYSVKEYTHYLQSICYQKRNKQNPYYNTFVIAGFEGNEPYLASVDLYGSHIVKDYVTAGFSKHFGLSLIALEWNPTKSYEECKQIIKKCFSVIYLRDCHSLDQVRFAKIIREGVKIEQPEKIDSAWDIRDFRERDNAKLWQ